MSTAHSRAGVQPRVVFVTGFCPHYRVRTFEALARHTDVEYLFYSDGQEWYWLTRLGTKLGDFRAEYLKKVRLGPISFTPALVSRLWSGSYDAVVKCINGRFALAATYSLARLRRKPFVLWTGIWMTLRTPFHRIAFPLVRHIYRHADAIVVYGEHVKRYLVAQGVDASRIFLAPQAVDNELYCRPAPKPQVEALRASLGLREGDRVVLYVGRLEAGKGLNYLVTAVSGLQAAGAVLVVVGEGAQAESLKRKVRELGLDHSVRFAGYVSPEQTPAFYALAYCLVLPSVTTPQGKEPWGLVVNEAMNQGLPAIATEAVGAAAGGLMQDGVNGFIVPERDSGALRDAMKRLLDDPGLRDRMGENARRAVAAWDNEHMALGFRQAIDFVTRHV